VPFPFVERPRLRPRPALLITSEPLGGPAPLGWVLMITSAANAAWPDDISLEERFAECGLPIPCRIRTAKVATVDLTVAAPMGSLPSDLWALVRQTLAGRLTLSAPLPDGP